MGRSLTILRAVLVGLLFVAMQTFAVTAAPAENRASGSAATPDNLIGIEPRPSAEAVRENVTIGYEIASDDAVAARAGSKIPVPSLKSSPFGPKIGDAIPTNGVPRNWSRDQIEDAISDYRTSIGSRRAELAAFDALGGGSATQRLAHAQRITAEESFLKSLEKALGR